MLRGWDSLDAERPVRDAPVLDEPTEGVVGDESEVGEWGAGDRAGGVAGGDPRLDAGPVVGLTGADRDGVTHQLEGDRTAEMIRYLNAQIQRL